MKEVILVKYGEIILKGLNRSKFEDLLIRNIKKAVGRENLASVKKAQAIIYLEPQPTADVDAIMEKLQKVFGIVNIYIYLCNMSSDNKPVDKCHIGYAHSLNQNERYKSQIYPRVKYVIFEEFITDKLYLPNECETLQQYTSTATPAATTTRALRHTLPLKTFLRQ